MNKRTEKGFTLIELTTAIVIMAILGVIAGTGLVQIVNGFNFAKKNTTAAEQAQIALTRIAKELSELQAIDDSGSQTNASAIRYLRNGDWHTLAWSATDQRLMLDGDALLEQVHVFSLSYRSTYNGAAAAYSAASSVIEISIELRVFNDVPILFVQRMSI
jgi:prepilin-type N-terminal cleavage/methylation domain-containing protein